MGFKINGMMRDFRPLVGRAALEGLRLEASKKGVDLDKEAAAKGFDFNADLTNDKVLYFRAKMLGYDLPNGNGDAIPRVYASDFGPSFIGKHLDLNHETDVQNIIGKVVSTFHVEAPMPGEPGAERIVGQNALADDDSDATRELQLEGICRIDRNTELGELVAQKLIAGTIDGVSQEASTEYAKCSVCGHKVGSPFEKVCAHLENGSLMIQSFQVEGRKHKVLAFKEHHNPVGTGLAVVTVPAYDRGRVQQMAGQVKAGKLSLEAALLDLREQAILYKKPEFVMEAIEALQASKTTASLDSALTKLNGHETLALLEKFKAPAEVKAAGKSVGAVDLFKEYMDRGQSEQEAAEAALDMVSGGAFSAWEGSRREEAIAKLIKKANDSEPQWHMTEAEEAAARKGKPATGCAECDAKGLSDCVHQYLPNKAVKGAKRPSMKELLDFVRDHVRENGCIPGEFEGSDGTVYTQDEFSQFIPKKEWDSLMKTVRGAATIELPKKHLKDDIKEFGELADKAGAIKKQVGDMKKEDEDALRDDEKGGEKVKASSDDIENAREHFARQQLGQALKGLDDEAEADAIQDYIDSHDEEVEAYLVKEGLLSGTDDEDQDPELVTCQDCDGEGNAPDGGKCSTCAGTGMVSEGEPGSSGPQVEVAGQTYEAWDNGDGTWGFGEEGKWIDAKGVVHSEDGSAIGKGMVISGSAEDDYDTAKHKAQHAADLAENASGRAGMLPDADDPHTKKHLVKVAREDSALAKQRLEEAADSLDRGDSDLEASFFRQPKPLDSYWAVFSPAGQLLTRVSIGALSGGKTDRMLHVAGRLTTLAKHLTSASWQRDLAAESRRRGVVAVVAELQAAQSAWKVKATEDEGFEEVVGDFVVMRVSDEQGSSLPWQVTDFEGYEVGGYLKTEAEARAWAAMLNEDPEAQQDWKEIRRRAGLKASLKASDDDLDELFRGDIVEIDYTDPDDESASYKGRAEVTNKQQSRYSDDISYEFRILDGDDSEDKPDNWRDDACFELSDVVSLVTPSPKRGTQRRMTVPDLTPMNELGSIDALWSELDKVGLGRVEDSTGYSGRGMMGKESPFAFTVDDTTDAQDRKLREWGLRRDSMGRRTIYYLELNPFGKRKRVKGGIVPSLAALKAAMDRTQPSRFKPKPRVTAPSPKTNPSDPTTFDPAVHPQQGSNRPE